MFKAIGVSGKSWAVNEIVSQLSAVIELFTLHMFRAILLLAIKDGIIAEWNHLKVTIY